MSNETPKNKLDSATSDTTTLETDGIISRVKSKLNTNINDAFTTSSIVKSREED